MVGLEKTCTTCGVTKPVSEYYRQKKGRYGVEARCKVCNKAYKRTLYATPEGRATKNRLFNNWRIANLEYWNSCQARWARERKAKRKAAAAAANPQARGVGRKAPEPNGPV